MLEKDMQKIIDALPYLHEILTDKYAFYAIDLVNMKKIVVEEGSIKVNEAARIKVGDEEKDKYSVYEALKKSKKPMLSVVPKGHYNETVKAILIPVLNDQGDVVAAFSSVRSMEKEVEIEEASSTVYNAVSELSGGIEEIASTSQQLFTFIKGMADFSSETQKRIKEIDEILKVMKNIASQSKLLALNAAIEAARAGDAGRGFSVVAAEMGKLSGLSNQSAEKVNKSLISIRDAINTITEQIEKTSISTETQTSATEEVAATSQDLLEVIQHLADISRVSSLEE